MRKDTTNSQGGRLETNGWYGAGELAGITAAPLSQAFTPTEVRNAARRFLDMSRYVQVSLVPER